MKKLYEWTVTFEWDFDFDDIKKKFQKFRNTHPDYTIDAALRAVLDDYIAELEDDVYYTITDETITKVMQDFKEWAL